MEGDPTLYIGAPDPLRDHPRYSTLRLLSQGSCGVVNLAYDTVDRDYVAVKLIERSADKLTKNVEREIINHSLLSHPHVIRFRECFLTTKHLAIVMEYVAGGNLHQLVNSWGGLPETLARWFFQQLIVALDYCHKMSICSRDVKLENTLIDNPADPSKAIIKLCDFGYSINEAHSLPQSAVGTPGYTAPEILVSRCRYDAKQADVWSCGVMLYIMLYCAYPFERPEDVWLGPKKQAQANAQRIMAADYQLPASPAVSSGCRDLLSRILVPGPQDRITVAEIQKHPWFREDLPKGIEGLNSKYLGDVNQTNAQALTVRTILRGALEAATCPPPSPPAPSRPFPMPPATASHPPAPGAALPKTHPRTISSIPCPSPSSSRTSTAAPICPACRPALVPEPSLSQTSHSHTSHPRTVPTYPACSPGLVPEPSSRQALHQNPSMGPRKQAATGFFGSPHLVAEQHRQGGHLLDRVQVVPGGSCLDVFPDLTVPGKPSSRPCHAANSGISPRSQHPINAPYHVLPPRTDTPSLHLGMLHACFPSLSPAPSRAVSNTTDATCLSWSHIGVDSLPSNSLPGPSRPGHSLPGLTSTPRGTVSQKRVASLPSSTGTFQLPPELAAPEAAQPLLELPQDLLDMALAGFSKGGPGLHEVSSQALCNGATSGAAHAAVQGSPDGDDWLDAHSSRDAANWALPGHPDLSTPWYGAPPHQPMHHAAGLGSKSLQPRCMPAGGCWSNPPAGMQNRDLPDSGHLVCRGMGLPLGP